MMAGSAKGAGLGGAAGLAALSLRIDLDAGGRIGPGKIALLEHIAAAGSIAAAGRAMGMSYRRAWELVEEANALFGRPVVEGRAGGRRGGGAQLTSLGRGLVTRYRAVEAEAADAARRHLSDWPGPLPDRAPDEAEGAAPQPLPAGQG